MTQSRTTKTVRHSETVASRFDVYFVAKPFGGANQIKRKAGLLSLVKQDVRQAQRLINQSATRIAQLVPEQQARLWVHRLHQSGWQAALVKNGKVCFRSQSQLRESQTKTIDTAANGAGAVKLESATASGKVRLKRLPDAEGFGSFCIPVNWQAMPQLNPNACLSFGDSAAELYWIAIRQTKQSVGALVPLRHYAEAVCEAAKHWVTDGRLIGELSPMEGKSAFLGRLSGKVGDKPVSYQLGIHESKKHFYCTYGWTTAEQFSRYRLLFQAMTSSFNSHK